VQKNYIAELSPNAVRGRDLYAMSATGGLLQNLSHPRLSWLYH
jgi:hypothetical protein